MAESPRLPSPGGTARSPGGVVRSLGRAVRRAAGRPDPRPLAVGVTASWAALAPSLVPRRWWMTGLSVAFTAPAAALNARLVIRAARGARRLPPLRPSSAPGPADPLRIPLLSPRPPMRTAATGAALLVAASGAVLAGETRRQRDLAHRVRMRPESDLQQVLGYLAGGAGWVALELVVRLSRRLRLRTIRTVAARIPSLPGPLVTVAVTLLILRADRWLLERLLRRLDEHSVVGSFAGLGSGPRPSEPERSGSLASYEPFLTMGLHGRRFVTQGPRAVRISEVWERLRETGDLSAVPAGIGTVPGDIGTVPEDAAFADPTGEADAAAASGPGAGLGDGSIRGTVREPIRVFIGRLGHPDPREAAEAAVAELERTGAFDRRAILLATGTGSGWVPPWQAAAFEHLLRGDCAVVSAQYSFAGSWLAFLIHRSAAVELSLALRRAVRARLDAMPASERPLLYATGESLGAYGGLGAYGSAGAMLRRLDGAVWTGTPRAARILAELLRTRRRGSPEVRPVHGTGRHFRFVGGPQDLWAAPDGLEYGSWSRPRVVFAQHPSDPVVWWSPALVWHRPDWLREPLGRGVSPGLRWRPFITFAQLTVDMPRSVDMPGGYGHSYHGEVVHYWNAVLGTGLSARACEEIAAAIAADLAPAGGSLPISDVSARILS
ncbi:alpha/beta-hydrolase family protein [Brevibacterium salitolerans]